MEILFLGTGATIPSRDRVMPCVAVRHVSDVVLFDCGEGSQRQLMLSPFSFMKISGIFITHMHGDHVLGLPGLLQTMSMSGRKDPLIVCGPSGFAKGLEGMLSICEGEISYPLDVRELNDGDVVEFKGFNVSAFRNEHNIPSLGYYAEENDTHRFDREKATSMGIKPGPDFSRLQNGESVCGVTPDMVMGDTIRGCKVVYSGDTVPCDRLTEVSKDADVLIHESTYSEEHAGLAKEHWHSTATQAAMTARGCGCRALMLIHISNRYENRDSIREEAAVIFENTIIPSDLEMFSVTRDNIRSV